MDTTIRWMIRRDWPEILAIEDDSRDDPWGERDLRSELKMPGRVGMVYELGDTIAGFMVYAIGRHGIEVVRFSVHPLFRRTGIGTAMAERLKGKLGGVRAFVEFAVPDSMLEAHLFLRAVGFRAEFRKIRSGVDDVYVFAYKLSASERLVSPARESGEAW